MKTWNGGQFSVPTEELFRLAAATILGYQLRILRNKWPDMVEAWTMGFIFSHPPEVAVIPAILIEAARPLPGKRFHSYLRHKENFHHRFLIP